MCAGCVPPFFPSCVVVRYDRRILAWHGTQTPFAPFWHGRRSNRTCPIRRLDGGRRQAESTDTRLGTIVVWALTTSAPPITEKAPFRIASGPRKMALKTSQKAAMECHGVPFLCHSYVTPCFMLAVRPDCHPNNGGFEPGSNSLGVCRRFLMVHNHFGHKFRCSWLGPRRRVAWMLLLGMGITICSRTPVAIRLSCQIRAQFESWCPMLLVVNRPEIIGL